MKDTVWPKDIMIPEMEKYGREITPCHPMPSYKSMKKELEKYPHLKRTKEEPQWNHLCGNGGTSGHFCANPDHIILGDNKLNGNMPDAVLAKSKAMAGRVFHPEHKEKLKKAKQKENHPMWGKSHSPETREKMSKTRKGKPMPKATCPHCGEIGGANNMKRWHFDNCPTLRGL